MISVFYIKSSDTYRRNDIFTTSRRLLIITISFRLILVWYLASLLFDYIWNNMVS